MSLTTEQIRKVNKAIDVDYEINRDEIVSINVEESSIGKYVIIKTYDGYYEVIL